MTTPPDDNSAASAPAEIAPRYTTELLQHRAPEARAEWSALYDAVGTIPFQSPQWIDAWFSAYSSPTDEPWVIAVREHGELIGVAPLLLERVVRGAARRVVAAGSAAGSGILELPSTLHAPDSARAVNRAIVGHLVEHADRWDWAQVTLRPDMWFEPEWLPAGGEFAALPHTSRPVPVVSYAPDASKPGRNLKESLRRGRNRLKRDFPDNWQVRRTSAPGDIHEAFNRLAALHASRSSLDGRKHHPNVIASPDDHAFLADAVRRNALNNAVDVYELVAGDQVLAALLVFRTARSSHFSISGMDGAAWDYSPMTLLQGAAMDDARAAGLEFTAPGTGIDVAKLRWGASVEIHHEFAIVGPRRRSRLAFGAYGQASTAAALARESGRHRIAGRASGDGS